MMWGIIAYNVYYICLNLNFLDSWKIHLKFFCCWVYQFNLFLRFFVFSWKEQQWLKKIYVHVNILLNVYFTVFWIQTRTQRWNNSKTKLHASFSEGTIPFYFHDTSIFKKSNGLKCRYFIICRAIHLEEWRCKNLQCLLPRVHFI